MATAVDIWNGLPAGLMLQGEASGWCTVLKMCSVVYALDLHYMYVYEVYYIKKA